MDLASLIAFTRQNLKQNNQADIASQDGCAVARAAAFEED
jgi:hypothetical protein